MDHLDRRHLIVAGLLFFNFPIFMGLYVWLTEGVEAVKARLGGADGAQRQISTA